MIDLTGTIDRLHQGSGPPVIWSTYAGLLEHEYGVKARIQPRVGTTFSC